jgi:hypothetical protein
VTDYNFTRGNGHSGLCLNSLINSKNTATISNLNHGWGGVCVENCYNQLVTISSRGDCRSNDNYGIYRYNSTNVLVEGSVGLDNNGLGPKNW